MQATDEAVEGYSNYATFGVAVVIDNDPDWSKQVRDSAERIAATIEEHENVQSGIWTAEQAARFELADHLKDFAQQLCERGNPSLLGAQMIQAGLAEVNWHELADDYLGELGAQ